MINLIFLSCLGMNNSSFDELKEDDFEEKKTCRILSLDGGGVRGIMELYFLKKMEEHLGPIHETFHIVGGSSIGGIESGLLTLPDHQESKNAKYSADYLFDYMQKNTDQMFDSYFFSFCGMFGPQYKTPRRFISHLTGDALNTEALTDTMIMTYDLGKKKIKPIWSTNLEEKFKLKDVLLATSAAPTYFKPIRVSSVNSENPKEYLLSDGGISANNPLLNLLSKAQRVYPEANKYQIVSLGTGVFEKRIDYNQIHSAGILEWGKNIISVFMDGQQSNTYEIISDLGATVSYSRWSPDITESETDMDNTSKKNMKALLKNSQNLLESREKEFNTLVDSLKDPKIEFHRKSFH